MDLARAVEDTLHAGFPRDCAAVLLIEGWKGSPRPSIEAQAAANPEVCRRHKDNNAREGASPRRTQREGSSVEGQEERVRPLSGGLSRVYVQDGRA